MYEGCEGRQGRVARRIEPLELRVVVATTLAIVAATTTWPLASRSTHGSARVELLAPRGRLDGLPSGVVWSTASGADRIRVVVADRTGEVVVDKSAAGSEASAHFDADERNRIGRCACGSIQLFAVAADGELLGTSSPARFTLPGASPGDERR